MKFPGRTSLRGRVTVTALIILSVWAIALTVLLNVILVHRLSAQADEILRTRAQAAATTLSFNPDGTVIIKEGLTDDSALDANTWIFSGSDLLEGPPGTNDVAHEAISLTGRGNVVEQTGGPTGVRWYAEPIMHNGSQAATVVTSLSMAAYDGIQRAAVIGTAIFAVLFLAGFCVALWAGVGRALKPVHVMTMQAAQWSAESSDERFGRSPRPAELQELATNFDALLDRHAALLRHEQNLSAEISHELRTPLTRIVLEADLLDSERTALTSPAQASLDEIKISATELNEILEALLVAARNTNQATVARCDVRDLITRLIGRRHLTGISFELVNGAPAHALADTATLTRAITPVLDNAARFARSRVELRVTTIDSNVIVYITDDGPGIPETALSKVFDPGYQEPSSQSHNGAGLGLALARRIIKSVGGTITAEPSESGAVIKLVLPAAPTSI